MSKVHEHPKMAVAEEVRINYPLEGERITGAVYIFRIETMAPGSVEVSIDQNEWQPCRQAGGYWWYDWSGYAGGKHRAVARIRPANGGKRYISHALNFSVELPGA